MGRGEGRIQLKQKHGVSFETAALALAEAEVIIESVDRRRDYGETRVRAYAENSGLVLAVILTRRGGRSRVISARKASKYERETYFKTKKESDGD